LTGARSIITVVVAMALGGGLSVVLNALGTVPVISGVGAPLRSRQIDLLDSVFVIEGCLASSLKHSLELLSVIETKVDRRMYCRSI